jgi:predicted MPP superfamily phosphohydrolase
MKERLRIIQISDLHITTYKNLLAPIVDIVNKEFANLVVITGDTVQFNDDEESFKIASDTINKIHHKKIIIPGDYDSGDLWNKYFGEPHQSIFLNGYNLDFLDTSSIGHKYFYGWSDLLKQNSTDQYDWFKTQLATKKNFHIVFSHHPFCVMPRVAGEEYYVENLRAVYSGHFRNPIVFNFNYTNRNDIKGMMCVPMKFHGSSCYLIISIGENDEIGHIPKFISLKRTAW